MIEATQDKLFQRDARWTQKSRNPEVGDIVWLIKDSALERKLKCGLVVWVCKDEEGICRDAYVRVLPKPEGPEPYILPFQK